MTMVPEDARCWTYLLANRDATADMVAMNCDVSVEYAQSVIARIASPNWREGVKYDADKPRYDLIPPEVEEAMAVILAFGAKKYGERNWEKGMRWGRLYRAARSHLNAWWARKPADDETGCSHLWHAACCVAFLVAFEIRGVGTDDRQQVSTQHRPPDPPRD